MASVLSGRGAVRLVVGGSARDRARCRSSRAGGRHATASRSADVTMYPDHRPRLHRNRRRDEGLHHSLRGDVLLATAFDEPEAGPELAVQFISPSSGPPGGRCNGWARPSAKVATSTIPPARIADLHLAHIAFAIGRAGEEVEHGPIVPHVDAVIREDGGEDIGHLPVHRVCGAAEAPPGVVERAPPRCRAR